MRKERDYANDLAEIRSMMERTSKFLSLTGWAGIMAGFYALFGAYVAYDYLNFNPKNIVKGSATELAEMNSIIGLGILVLLFAVGTAVLLSYRKARKRKESLWNPTSRRLLFNLSAPLISGGIVILLLLSKGFVGLIAPLSLIFYGLGLISASYFTYSEVKMLGLIQISLGLLGIWMINWGLVLWAVGFGLFHIIYGIFLHYKYEK